MGRRQTIDAIVTRLADAGRRRTAPRQAIVECLVNAGGHVTADEVAAQVQSRFPSVNISTVYRTLDALEEIGVIDHVHLGHSRAVYHLVEEDHQHLVCESCEAVEELPASRLKPLIASIERDFGFEVDRRHFAIVGRCRRCRKG
jgi:Fe2+ or Zn2+ uptake regulation protein